MGWVKFKFREPWLLPCLKTLEALFGVDSQTKHEFFSRLFKAEFDQKTQLGVVYALINNNNRQKVLSTQGIPNRSPM